MQQIGVLSEHRLGASYGRFQSFFYEKRHGSNREIEGTDLRERVWWCVWLIWSVRHTHEVYSRTPFPYRCRREDGRLTRWLSISCWISLIGRKVKIFRYSSIFASGVFRKCCKQTECIARSDSKDFVFNWLDNIRRESRDCRRATAHCRDSCRVSLRVHWWSREQ